MSYSTYGAGAAFLLVFGVAGLSAVNRTASYTPAKASVYLIDRKCNMVETTTEATGRTAARGYIDDCKSNEEWESVREKRNKTVAGKAVIHVNYTAPQDGSSRTSKLEFDGRDDEFYELKAGDEIDVLVSNSDPSQVIKG